MNEITLDQTDPVVAMIAWALTFAVSKMPKIGESKNLRSALPLVAVLIAVGARTAMDSLSGVAFSWATIGHAIAAGGLAVLAHSQFSELMKVAVRSRSAKAPAERDDQSEEAASGTSEEGEE